LSPPGRCSVAMVSHRHGRAPLRPWRAKVKFPDGHLTCRAIKPSSRPSLQGRGRGWVGERSEPSTARHTRHRIDPEQIRWASARHGVPQAQMLASPPPLELGRARQRGGCRRANSAGSRRVPRRHPPPAPPLQGGERKRSAMLSNGAPRTSVPGVIRVANAARLT
jgi:hypothetical protein